MGWVGRGGVMAGVTGDGCGGSRRGTATRGASRVASAIPVALSLSPARLGDGTWGPLVTPSQYCMALGCSASPAPVPPVPPVPCHRVGARPRPLLLVSLPASPPPPPPVSPAAPVGAWGAPDLPPLWGGRRFGPMVVAKGPLPSHSHGRQEGSPPRLQPLPPPSSPQH